MKSKLAAETLLRTFTCVVWLCAAASVLCYIAAGMVNDDPSDMTWLWKA